MDARATSAKDQPPGEDLLSSLIALAHTLRTQPCHHARSAAKLATELLGILAGADAAGVPHDPRFTQPGWQWPVQRRALQAWLAWRQHGSDWIEGLEIAELDRARLRLVNHHLAEALCPANGPLNPELIEQVLSTGGRNLRDGLRSLARDTLQHRPLPAQTEDGALHVGRDLAATPGAVIHRTPLFELIHYQPTTAQVASLPLLIIPPPLNRFYLLDMTPQSSLVRHALDQGLQVFMISWRNPNPSHCNWGFEHYVNAADEALRLACNISNSHQATLLGVCAGGLIGLLLQGYYAASGASLVAAASYLITPIDPSVVTDASLLAGPSIYRILRNRVWRQGCLTAGQLAAGFAWLRPEQLIWPYVMQRYLLAQELPAHPIKFWNQDCTRLPAQLVDDLLSLYELDPLGRTDELTINGAAVDLHKVEAPSWHLGAWHDHIVPWNGSYPTNRMGGKKTFVLSSGGHIQSVVNPPHNPRTWHQIGAVGQLNAAHWLEAGVRHQGSWWSAWSTWMLGHSGELHPAPQQLGSATHPPLQAAPGRYVHQL